MSDRARLFLTITFLAVGAFIAAGLATAHGYDWPFDRGASVRDVTNRTGPFSTITIAFTLEASIECSRQWD